MPEFFFHVSIEIVADRRLSTEDETIIATWPSGVGTLSPFLSRKKASIRQQQLQQQQLQLQQQQLQLQQQQLQLQQQQQQQQRRRSLDGFRSPAVSLESPSRGKFNEGSARAGNRWPGKDPKGSLAVSRALPDDKRLDQISIECTNVSHNIVQAKKMSTENHISKGIGSTANGLQTKGEYEPLDQRISDSIWGIVHLYRDADETPGLYGDSLLSKASNPWYSRVPRENQGTPFPPAAAQDCTTLCILAVPSYLAPSDFLGFVGEDTRAQVSHFRMIRTARANRYMVLMKFRDGKSACSWQKSWNGKVFNSMEPETCHVVFLKSVEITITSPSSPDTFPDMKNDPFTSSHAPNPSSLSLAKPLAPRTSALVELPTCPVCLERMDETTGLLTILCQHVFHCTCLQKWSGGGCPVCRYTHDDFSSRPRLNTKTGKKEWHGDSYGDDPIECETCHMESNLWQCLVCGKIGCSRYEAKHAFSHYEDTGHSFAMDMASKRVWDYAGDGYVHRIIQNSTDGLGGKLVELPGSRHGETALDPADEVDDRDSLAREKMEGLSLEYTHLLTSQLESQRVYFEEQVERAADKAAQASAEAARALAAAHASSAELAELKSKYDDLARDAVPALEREKARLEKRADKFEGLARKMEKEYGEEKAINGRLMERIGHLGHEVEALKGVKQDLEEQNRDLTFFISSSERLREAGEEVQEGTVTVPDPPSSAGKRKGKGKGRGGK